MSELHAALREVGLEQIYLQDGSINFDVVGACVEGVLSRQEGLEQTLTPSPLNDFSFSTWSVEVNVDNLASVGDSIGDRNESGQLVIRDPFDFALQMYFARQILGDLKDFGFDSDVGEVSPGLAEDP